MENKTMTQREFFEAIRDFEGMSENLVDYATMSIEKLDKRNEARKSKVSKKALENKPLYDKVLELLDDKDMIASQIATELGVTVQKASSLCVHLVKEDKIKSYDVKVKGKGKQKCYTTNLDEEVEE